MAGDKRIDQLGAASSVADTDLFFVGNPGTGALSKVTKQTLLAIYFGSQSVATAAGTTTLTVSSPYETVFTGTSTQTLKLPDATTLVDAPGTPTRYHIINNSSGIVTIQDNGSNTRWVLASGGEAFLLLTDNSTSNGTWDISHPVFVGSGKMSNFDQINSSGQIDMIRMGAIL